MQSAPPQLPRSQTIFLIITVLLAHAAGQTIPLPAYQNTLILFNVVLHVEISLAGGLAVLAALLTISGMDNLLQGHPGLENQPTPPHWILPGLTAWAIQFPLRFFLSDYRWIGVLLVEGLLLGCVIWAEFVSVNYQDSRNAVAAPGLTAYAFALLLWLAYTLKSADARLLILLMLFSPIIAGISFRSINLRTGKRQLLPALGMALVSGQWITMAHFLPLTPISFGLVILAPAYALTILLGNLAEGIAARKSWFEPLAALLLLWGLAWWVR